MLKNEERIAEVKRRIEEKNDGRDCGTDRLSPHSA